MSLLLTDRQKSDLNNAIFDYLSSQSEVFSQSALVFKQEAGIDNADPSAKGLLAKKWISVVRLQKKIMELEVKLEQANRSEGGVDAAAVAVSAIGVSGDIRQLPKPPAKHCLTGHRLSVTALATHPVYSLLASGSEDCTIRLWDHETAQYERTLKGHTGPVTSVAFDSKGLLLASSSADMSAKLWDMSSFACTKTFKGHDHTVSSVLFLPGDDRLATCSRDQTIKLWDLSSGYCVRTFTGHTDWVKCVSISVDGVYIASGSSDQSIMIWEFASGKLVQTLRGHEHVVEAVSYGRKPVDAATIVALSSPVRSTEIMSEYSYLVSGSRDKTVKLWDPLKNTCLATFTCHDNWVRSVLLHPNGKYIISCSDDKSIRVVDIKEARCVRTISEAHHHFVTSLSLSKSYPVIASGGVDKAICIWSCS